MLMTNNFLDRYDATRPETEEASDTRLLRNMIALQDETVAELIMLDRRDGTDRLREAGYTKLAELLSPTAAAHNQGAN